MCANADREVAKLSVENTALRAQLAEAQAEIQRQSAAQVVLDEQIGKYQEPCTCNLHGLARCPKHKPAAPAEKGE